MAGGGHFALVGHKDEGALAVGDECIGERGNEVGGADKGSGVECEWRYCAVGCGSEIDNSGGVKSVAAADVGQLLVSHTAELAPRCKESEHMSTLVKVEVVKDALAANRGVKLVGIIHLLARAEQPVVGSRDDEYRHGRSQQHG